MDDNNYFVFLMDDQMTEEDMKKEALVAVELASHFISELERKNCKPQIAYAAFGNAFYRMHWALEKTKEEWLEVTKQMGKNLKD